MKRLIPYIAFTCLAGFTVTNGIPVMAGSCSSHIEKPAEINCATDDIECQIIKSEKYGLNKTDRS